MGPGGVGLGHGVRGCAWGCVSKQEARGLRLSQQDRRGLVVAAPVSRLLQC